GGVPAQGGCARQKENREESSREKVRRQKAGSKKEGCEEKTCDEERWRSGRHATAVAIDHPDIAGIDWKRQARADQERPCLQMHRIDEADQSADQAAIPEGDRNDAVAFLFAAEPLNQKAHAEYRLATEAD